MRGAKYTFSRSSPARKRTGKRTPMETGREEPRTAACRQSPPGNPGREKEKNHRRRETRRENHDGDDTLGALP